MDFLKSKAKERSQELKRTLDSYKDKKKNWI